VSSDVIAGRSAKEFLMLELAGIRTFVIGGEDHPDGEGVATTWFDHHGCKAAIVRPDHYVYRGISDRDQVGQIWHDLQAAIAAINIECRPS
jgi:hypothetical protein